MSSTLCIRKTPTRTKGEWHFKLPLKGLVAQRFYNHDGSLGGGVVTIGAAELPWFEGVLAAGSFCAGDTRALEQIVEILRSGETVDMWFET